MIYRYRNVFIYVFAMFQEVSLSIIYCGSQLCFDGRCCFDACCPERPEMPEMPPNDNSQFVIPVAIFGAFGGFVFILVVCIVCYNIRKKSRARQPQQPTWSQPIPPPPFAPPGPTAPPLILVSDPPPYSEVIGFPPVPVGQPPCYDNIAMEDLSSVESVQLPGSRLKD